MPSKPNPFNRKEREEGAKDTKKRALDGTCKGRMRLEAPDLTNLRPLLREF
jgi:hypothetical protein